MARKSRRARVGVFQPEFRKDLQYWIRHDPRTALRILDLAEAALRNPLEGIGKPEPLKHYLRGCWSRRITQEHRLIYLVQKKRVDFLLARYHY